MSAEGFLRRRVKGRWGYRPMKLSQVKRYLWLKIKEGERTAVKGGNFIVFDHAMRKRICRADKTMIVFIPGKDKNTPGSYHLEITDASTNMKYKI